MAQVSATDADVGPFGEVAYALAGDAQIVMRLFPCFANEFILRYGEYLFPNIIDILIV